MSKLSQILILVPALLLVGACDGEAQLYEHDGEYFQRQAPDGQDFSGGYQWTASRFGETEYFNLTGPQGATCLAVPAAGFPDPAPQPGQQCIAVGCVEDPAWPGCYTCEKLVCADADGDDAAMLE